MSILRLAAVSAGVGAALAVAAPASAQTPGQPLQPVQLPAPKPTFVVVAIGDSYSSGEGNPQTPGQHNASGRRTGNSEVWGPQPDDVIAQEDRRCHRSPKAWPSLVAQRLQAALPNTQVVFKSFACSGATIDEKPEFGGALFPDSGGGAITPYGGAEPGFDNAAPLPPQITQVNDYLTRKGLTKIDAIVSTFGGNDAGFGPVVAFCLGNAKIFSFNIPFVGRREVNLDHIPCNLGTGGLVANTRDLAGHYDNLGKSLAGITVRNGLNQNVPGLSVRPGKIYVGAYPDPSTDNGKRTCNREGNDPIYRRGDKNEAKFILDELVKPMNTQVRNAATRNGWTFVDEHVSKFRGHGICAGDRFFRTNAQGLRDQGNDNSGGKLTKRLKLRVGGFKIFGFELPKVERTFKAGLVFFKEKLSSAIAHPNARGHETYADSFTPKLLAQARAQGLN